jgi:hypothetical protein
MFTKAIAVAALTIAAGVVNAAETNPLHPAYPHFTAKANVQTVSGSVQIAKNPLTPGFYQWSVATPSNAKAPVIVENNPLQPGYTRS